MSDLKSLSDDQLRDLLRQAQDNQNAAAMSHPNAVPGEPDYLTNPNNPLYGSSFGTRLNVGIGRGMANVGRHAANLVGLYPDEKIREANRLDAPLMDTAGGYFGSMIGETAPLIPLTMGASAGLGALGGPGAALAGNPITNGMIMGAAQGGLMADPGSKAKGMLFGGITGAALPAIGKLFDKTISGINRTPEAQQLLDEGVRLTPGQMNPEGVMNKIEENVRGWPVVGNVVEKARARAGSDFQRNVIEDAAAPGTSLKSPTTDVNQLFQEAQDSYKPLYKQAEGFTVKPVVPSANKTLAKALQQSANDRAVGAGQEIRQSAEDFLLGKFQAVAEKAKEAGRWQSENLIDLRSRINEEIRGAGQDQAGKKYAELLRNARDKVTQSINDQIPPDASAALKVANDAYPKLAIIRDAIKRGGDQPGGFTPAQLSQAVRSATDNNQYARGEGLLRDWSSAGRDIFTQRNPHTGSALGTGLALAAGTYASPAITLPIGATGLGLIGTDVGRNFISGQTVWQEKARQLAQLLSAPLSDEAKNVLGTTSRTAVNRAFANSRRGREALSAEDMRQIAQALGTGGT